MISGRMPWMTRETETRLLIIALPLLILAFRRVRSAQAVGGGLDLAALRPSAALLIGLAMAWAVTLFETHDHKAGESGDHPRHLHEPHDGHD